MRDAIARFLTWGLRLLLPARGRHGYTQPNLVPASEPAVLGQQPEPPVEAPDTAGADDIFWCDEPLVRSFVLAQEERRAAERRKREEERLRRVHGNAADDGRDYPDMLYLRPDTQITVARAWTESRPGVRQCPHCCVELDRYIETGSGCGVAFRIDHECRREPR
ncbi:hypothetical protein ACH427_03090 [Streptomyces sp. NPDC020379]|uniref:hypothetical protein n=1 Tax=Streptomyces sp. NPDC020379 TaxID=3365071 RepID=UPI00378958A8